MTIYIMLYFVSLDEYIHVFYIIILMLLYTMFIYNMIYIFIYKLYIHICTIAVPGSFSQHQDYIVLGITQIYSKALSTLIN